MQQRLLGCSLLPVWLTRQASCSFPLQERYIFFNGLSSEQQALALLFPISCDCFVFLPALLIPPLSDSNVHSFSHPSSHTNFTDDQWLNVSMMQQMCSNFQDEDISCIQLHFRCQQFRCQQFPNVVKMPNIWQ